MTTTPLRGALALFVSGTRAAGQLRRARELAHGAELPRLVRRLVTPT
eukprot:CAMPEP_0197576144 /NCGR_PEP_ID=MMETSP1326-20131121/1275_1 /TAXON_ID=1155430 /ORGANISM="Genus nov. species nov., Strain RCC2288" /LENGTH=46 /DNA_ID= /DNA_START= /DNA_END= /DNA_ORIENTATION=